MSQIEPTTIADTELRLAMLRRLASLGMLLAEEVCERAINSPYHPEPRHEPARAFATVSRAVRLTLVLQARVEADLLALRNDQTILADKPVDPRVDRASETAAAEAIADDDLDDGAFETPDHERECLRERERFDEILSRSFDNCVAAIRDHLGLAPEDDVPPLRRAHVPSASVGASVVGEMLAPPIQERSINADDPPDSG